jgi:hypothetical protein
MTTLTGVSQAMASRRVELRVKWWRNLQIDMALKNDKNDV